MKLNITLGYNLLQFDYILLYLVSHHFVQNKNQNEL